MRQIVLMVLWAATLGVAGIILWRTTGKDEPVAEPAAVSSPAAPATSDPAAASRATANVVSASETPSPSSMFAYSPFQPLPLDVPLDGRKVALGDRLFHETALSADNTISCASCHDLSLGGMDNRRVSLGVGGQEGTLNAPTVLNGAYNFRQFWDGRAETLEQQVDGPLLHPAEMASRWEDVLARMQADSAYAAPFGDIYPDGVTAANLRDAIATFERSLVTPNSRFDRYLRGEADALSANELDGYRLFMETGCVSCHQGINVGGNMFQVFGRMGNYFADRGDVQPADLGRFNVTGDERDKHKFKVPSLRNVELTAPYFHDGSAATLEQAVQTMAHYQIGQPLHDDEVADLVAFLETLTGENARRP